MTILQRYEKSPKEGPGYEIRSSTTATNENCNIIVRLRNNGPDSGIEVKSNEGVRFNANPDQGEVNEHWDHVIVSYDGSGRARGIQVYIDGRSVRTTVVLDKLAAASFEQGELQIGNKDWGTPFKGQLSGLRIYDRRLYAGEAEQLGLLRPVRAMLEIPTDQRTDGQKEFLRNYFSERCGQSGRAPARRGPYTARTRAGSAESRDSIDHGDGRNGQTA